MRTLYTMHLHIPDAVLIMGIPHVFWIVYNLYSDCEVYGYAHVFKVSKMSSCLYFFMNNTAYLVQI